MDGKADPVTGIRGIGHWDTLSQNLANQASGDVVSITPLANESYSVWNRTELPALLDNPNVTSINGIDKGKLLAQYNANGRTADALLNVSQQVNTASLTDVIASGMRVNRLDNGILQVHAGDFLSSRGFSVYEDSSLPPGQGTRISQVLGQHLNANTEAFTAFKNGYNSLVDTMGSVASSSGGRMAGKVIPVAGLILASVNASAAYADGDEAGAARIMGEAVTSEVVGLGVELLATAAVVGGLIAFGVVSSPVIATAALVTAIAAGWAGGELGATAFNNGLEFLIENAESFGMDVTELAIQFTEHFNSVRDYVYGLVNEVPGVEILKSFADPIYSAIDDFFEKLGLPSPFVRRRDPVALDMNGDGIEYILVGESQAFFDLDGDGISENVSWVGKNDALLVADINGDGQISGFAGIFSTSDSAVADVRKLDSNGDSAISSEDDLFESFQIWTDVNGNGLAEQGELKTLLESGVDSIQLDDSTVTVNLLNGDVIQGEEFDIEVNNNNTRDYLVDADLLQGLPDFNGRHGLHSLAVTLYENPELQSLLSRAKESLNSEEYNEVLETLFLAWTGADAVGDTDLNSNSGYVLQNGKLVFTGSTFQLPIEQYAAVNALFGYANDSATRGDTVLFEGQIRPVGSAYAALYNSVLAEFTSSIGLQLLTEIFSEKGFIEPGSSVFALIALVIQDLTESFDSQGVSFGSVIADRIT